MLQIFTNDFYKEDHNKNQYKDGWMKDTDHRVWFMAGQLKKGQSL